jgi:hypothetical protein
MDIEHFSLLSSVIRKTESHEQDGKTLRVKARGKAASGDPAMAWLFQSVGTDGPFRPALLSGVHRRSQRRTKPAYNARGTAARETVQRRMPSLSISVL